MKEYVYTKEYRGKTNNYPFFTLRARLRNIPLQLMGCLY